MSHGITNGLKQISSKLYISKDEMREKHNKLKEHWAEALLSLD